MKFELKKGQHVYIGTTPYTLLQDTPVAVEASSIDQIAERLAAAGARAFAEHAPSLEHRDTMREMIDGEEHEVDIEVTYGAGGSRIETKVQGSTPRRLNAQGQGSTSIARGGVGTETIPGASGSGESAKARNRALKGPEATEEDFEPETAPQTQSKLRSRADFEDDDEQTPSTPRTEFVVPPKRFPDEVLTATDPPLSEVVADSPARATPYVGEFHADGSFTRQPGTLEHRAATEGRPNPSPDTAGTRDRELPHPSETDRQTTDETAKNLQRMQRQAETGDDSKGEDMSQSNKEPISRDLVSDLSKDEPPNDDKSDKQNADKGGKDELPEDIPHRTFLEEADVNLSDLRGKNAEELQQMEIPGIAEARAADIADYLKKHKIK